MTKILPLPFMLLNLESLERKGKNYKKFEYLENENSFFNEIKKIFIVFEGYGLVKK